MLTTRPGLGLPTEDGGDHGAESALSLPVCPLARQGLASSLTRRCPGFDAVPLTFAGLGAGESLGERETCRHLGVQRGARGFVTACRHPGGRPCEAVELARRAAHGSSSLPAN